MTADEKPYLLNYLRYCRKKVEDLKGAENPKGLQEARRMLHNAYLRVNQYEMQFWGKIPRV